jgi:hypothetical protein
VWWDKKLEDKRKLKYYKEVVNLNVKKSKYLLCFVGQSPKLPHLCDTYRVEDENHFLLECPAYTQIRSQFQNICHNADLLDLLSHQNYGDLTF